MELSHKFWKYFFFQKYVMFTFTFRFCKKLRPCFIGLKTMFLKRGRAKKKN